MGGSGPERRSSLPVHPVPVAPPTTALRLDGLVERPGLFTPADLAILHPRALRADFACVEGWVVPGLGWEGVALAELLALVRPLPEARWLQASAGDFSVPLPLAVAEGGLLALRLDGQPLPPEHGGPLRLVVPGQDCVTSVKWLDHLELRAEPGPNTGAEIARRRLASRR